MTPLAAVHPSGSRLEYTLAFVTGCVSTSEGLMVCAVHHPAATGLCVTLTGYEHRLDGSTDRVLMPFMIDLTDDELTIAGAIDKVLDLWAGSPVAGRREQFQSVLRQLITDPGVPVLGGSRPATDGCAGEGETEGEV